MMFFNIYIYLFIYVTMDRDVDTKTLYKSLVKLLKMSPSCHRAVKLLHTGEQKENIFQRMNALSSQS